MKIAIIVQDITGFGGMVVVTLWLAKKLNEKHKVVIYSCKQRNTKPLYQSENLEIKYLNIPTEQTSLNEINCRNIENIIKQECFDIVILPVGCAFRNLYITSDISLIKRISQHSRIYFIMHESPLFHLKRYNTEHDNPFIYLLKIINHKLRYARSVKLFFKEAKKYVYKFVSLSEGCKKEFKSAFNIDSIVVYNPYTFDSRPINFEQKENYVVWAGRFSGEKNIRLLLKAWKLINDKKNWSLLLVGDGSNKELMQAYIEKERIENVKMLGTVSHEKILEIFSKSKIYCLPSFFEGFPTVISECMNYGVVPIVTKYDGFSEELLTEETGFICSYNAKQIASSMEYLMVNPAVLKTYSEKCYAKCKSFYNDLEARNYDLDLYK